MYHRYAQDHHWQIDVIDTSQNDLGGMNQIIMAISGQNVFARLKFESGVHRVQRVPTTESGGRIHTSAATVAVLQRQKKSILPLIKRICALIPIGRKCGGAACQYNRQCSTYIFPGGCGQCQDEKSQHKNRAKAMKVLMARLYDHASMAQDLERARIEKVKSVLGIVRNEFAPITFRKVALPTINQPYLIQIRTYYFWRGVG